MSRTTRKRVIATSITLWPEQMVWLDAKAQELTNAGQNHNMSSVLRMMIDTFMGAEEIEESEDTHEAK